MKFAKLFDLENEQQVLIQIDYDHEKEEDIVIVSTDFNSARASVRYAFNSEEGQLKMFNCFDINSAKKFRTSVENSLPSLS